LGVLKNTNMPAVLNEGAFVDNLKDIQGWNEDHELKNLGEAYAKAAAEFLGLVKKVADTKKPTDIKTYYVQVFAGSKAGAEKALKLAKEKGFTDAFIK
jgi:hypothetical protein